MTVMPMNLFSGLLIAPADIPNYWIWLYYLSFFQYPYQIFIVNEFQDLTFQQCDFSLGQYCPLGPCAPNNSTPMLALIPGNCSGVLLIQNMGYNINDMGMNFGILVGYFSAFMLLGWLAMRRLVRAKQ
jgi:hypothetical protein